MAEASRSPGTRALLTVQIGTTWLGLDAAPVAEILGARPWLPIPGAAAALPGVAVWRGRAIAVLDLGATLGGCPGLEPGQVRRRTLVVESPAGTVALPVDAVTAACDVEVGAIHRQEGTPAPHLAEETELDGRVVSLVDLSGLIQALVGSSPALRGAS